MRVALVFSRRDPASANMRRAFSALIGDGTELGPFSLSLVDVDRDLVYVESWELPDADSYVFLSRHVGGKSCFTLHATGNPGLDSRLGGRPRSLGIAAPLLSHAFLKALMESPPLPVVYEATHHGPTELAKPCIFVEVGVTYEDWVNPVYAGFVARSLLRALEGFEEVAERAACCFGGPHYASLFTEHAYTNGYAVGHILAKHSIVAGEREVVRMAVERCDPRPRYALVDWDGLRGDQRRSVLEEVGALGLKVVRL